MSRTDHHAPAKYATGPRRYRHPYCYGHGGGSAFGDLANLIERQARAELRGYRTEVVQAWRGGIDVEAIVEPDARPRHSAFRDFW